MKRVYLKSTGQEVQLFDAALPPALAERGQKLVRIIIPPSKPGEKPSVQEVRRSKLRFERRILTDA